MSAPSRLLDRTVCPDCRAPLDVTATCTRCRLRLVGPIAQRLYDTLVVADGLIGALREAPGVAPVAAPQIDATTLPSHPIPRPAPHQTRRGRPTVPAVLLGLGALCLLVAAVVFVAVAWGALGLGGRAAVLGGFTAVLGTIAATLTRRGLRLAAGAVWTVVHVLVAIDLLAAWGAGLAGLDAVPGRHLAAALGLGWLLLGLTVAWWSRALLRTPLLAAVVFAVAGAAVVTAAEAWSAERYVVATALALPLLALAAAGLRRTLPGVGLGLVAIGGVSWLVVLGDALHRVATVPDDATWWRDLVGWPLLVLAVAAAVPTRLRVPWPARSVAAAVCLAVLCLFAAGPSGGATGDRLTVAALALALGAVAALARPPWARPAAGLAGVGATALTADLLLRSAAAVADLPTWGANPLDLAVPDVPGSWTAALLAPVVLVVAHTLLRLVPEPTRSAGRTVLVAVAPTVLALGAADTVLEAGTTLLGATCALAAVVAVAAVTTSLLGRTPTVVLAGVAVAVWPAGLLLRAAAGSHLLAGATGTALALLLAAAAATASRRPLGGSGRPIAAATAVLVVGYAALRWADLAGADRATEALVVTGCAAVAALLAGPLGRLVPDGDRTRVSIELAAATLGAAAVALAASPAGGPAVAALTLTVLGATGCLLATVHADRAEVSWLGAVLLGVATLVRVADGVPAPERWTLPAAALLLAAGAWRWRSDRSVDSWRVLGSGLTLALLPSLLLALDDPIGARGALVAAAGLGALGVGVQARCAAPFAAGAVTTAVLTVRHLGPVAEALPRWITLGTVGVVLLAVGVSWESRRRNLAAAGHYLAGLR